MKLARAALLVWLLPGTAVAAERTWVSGVGDDANPCTRTAPCRTFARAITVVDAGGTIDVAAPGSFGSVTIDKSVTIDGGGLRGAIAAPAVNAILVNDSLTGTPGTAVVVLRRLDLHGGGAELGLAGVKLVAAGTVIVDDVTIGSFTTAIDARIAGTARLAVSNTRIVGAAAGNGILLSSSAGLLTAAVRDVQIDRTTRAIEVATNARAAIEDCALQHSTTGLFVGGSNAIAVVSRSGLQLNGTGIAVDNGGALHLHDSVVARNDTGITNNGGTSTSSGTSMIVANTAAGALPSVLGAQ
jgi:hypothetical protein